MSNAGAIVPPVRTQRRVLPVPSAPMLRLVVRFSALASAFALLTFPAPARAQEGALASHPRVREATALLDKWLDAQRAYQRIPSLTGAVVHDQTLVWQGASGYSNVEGKVAATPSTIYSICSISKLFTSISVMQLRDQGALRLDDAVGKHLSWFNIKRTHPEAGEITIEGLLTHASGLPREAAFPYWSAPDFVFPTRLQIIDALSSEETLYPPETFFQYSNLGLTLAGEVVRAASHQPYADYVRANILSPLGLSSTTPEIPTQEAGKRMAVGYGPVTRDGTRATLPIFTAKGIAPAAGYASTALDLARFADERLFRPLGATLDTWRRAPDGVPMGGNDAYLTATGLAALGEMMRRGGVAPDGRRVLSRAWVEASLAKQIELPERDVNHGTLATRGYGYLWWLLDFGGEEAFAALGHGGQELIVFPERELVVVFTSHWPGPSSTGHYRHLRRLLDDYALPAFPRSAAPSGGGGTGESGGTGDVGAASRR